MNENERVKWAGVPFWYRYSSVCVPPKGLVKEMQKIDPLLDLKFYLPKEEWHVVRYYHGRSSGKLTMIWPCIDDPNRGLRGGPGPWIIEALKAGDLRRRDIAREVDEQNQKADEAKDGALADAVLGLAEDIRKPAQALFDYGPDSTYHEVY